MTPFKSTAVAKVFDSYPAPLRRRLMSLRELIFRTAASTPGVGALEETLKWGEPAYVTAQGKGRSALRLGAQKSTPAQVAMYFNCQTTLVDSFRTMFPADFHFVGNRALVFDVAEPVPTDALGVCIAMALTYHAKRQPR